MADTNEPAVEHRDKSAWEERSKAWAKTTAQGKSQDDTLNQIIIAEAGIKPGDHVLDLASGSGNPAVSAALLMDGQGAITLTDLTEGMLANARKRADNLDIGIMHYCTADMTGLPFGDDTFDVATCRFGIMFPEDKVSAARETLRVLKPGGRVAYMVWDAYDKNPPFFVPRRTIAAFFREDEPPIPPRHAMSAPGTLENILKDAGYMDVMEKEVGYKNRVDDLDAYVTNGLNRSHGEKIKDLSGERLAELKQALFDAWAPYSEDGATFVPNCARVGIGVKPS